MTPANHSDVMLTNQAYKSLRKRHKTLTYRHPGLLATLISTDELFRLTGLLVWEYKAIVVYDKRQTSLQKNDASHLSATDIIIITNIFLIFTI